MTAVEVFDKNEMEWDLVQSETPSGYGLQSGFADFFVGKAKYQRLRLSDAAGLSVFEQDFAPRTDVPVHFHDVDQIQLVTAGQAVYGKRVLTPGQGVFTPGDSQYGFTAGPAGCRMLEFRDLGAWTTTFVDRRIVDAEGRKRAIAESSRRRIETRQFSGGKRPTIFFDLNTAPELRPADGHGPGGVHDLIPRGLEGKVAYRNALTDSMSRYSLFVQRLEAGAAAELSRSVASLCLVTDGSIAVDGEKLIPGQGAYVPAGVTFTLKASASGCTSLEFRPTTEWSTATS
jgi:hypothetical protein